MENFQVFLSHNSKDKALVRLLYRELVENWKIRAWLDEEELRPGLPWITGLQQGMKESSAIALLLGNHGLGDWQEEEMWVTLQLAARDKRPLIPVLLPDLPQDAAVPSLFLDSRTRVDLRPEITDEGGSAD